MFRGAFARASDAGRTPPEHRGELIAVLLGHAEQVGDDEQAERPANSPLNSPRPPVRNESSTRSANSHMNASFSLRRFGVISPISSARWSVWVGPA
jgi:hypothetical protein